VHRHAAAQLLLLALLQLLSQLPPHHSKLLVLCDSRLLLFLMLSLLRIEIVESLLLLFLMLLLGHLPLLGFLLRPLLGPSLRTLSLSECGHVGGRGRWRLGQCGRREDGCGAESTEVAEERAEGF